MGIAELSKMQLFTIVCIVQVQLSELLSRINDLVIHVRSDFHELAAKKPAQDYARLL